MQLPPHTIFAAHIENKAGMHGLRILTRTLHRRIEMLRGDMLCLSPNSVVFITTDQVRYSSRYFRLLPFVSEKDFDEKKRAHVERRCLEALMPWLADAKIVACINPSFLDPEHGICMNYGSRRMHLDGFTMAIRSLCGDFPPRTDLYENLSNEQKRDLRILARRLERKSELGLNR
jgi:hypothetical protein